MEKKCKVCGSPALKSQRTGLCSKHNMQYNRQRSTDGRTMAEFIKFMTMDVAEDTTKYEEITIDNASDQKILWQAKKEQEHTLRLSRENKARRGELVDKNESNKATGLVLSAILKDFETILDVWPPLLEHKSAGDIRSIMARQFDVTLTQIRGTLDELQK